MKDALQIVRFGKVVNELKTRYQQAQEDRLNDNFRLLTDKLQEIIDMVNAVAPADSNEIAVLANGIRLGKVDPDSTSTAFTARIPGITSYYDGLTVLLKNGVVTSAAGFTLDINGLGAKRVYSNMAAATAETTIFNANYTMLFTYDSTRVEGGGWICYRGYDSNTNTIGYQLRGNSAALPASQKFYRYRLLFTSADGKHLVPANTSTSTDATAAREVNQTKIDPFGRILYYGATAAVAADAKPSVSSLWEQYPLALGYSFNVAGGTLALTINAPVYLKCEPQADGSAIIDGTTPIVQALPSSEDGKIYIFLGIAYSATNIELYMGHPVYYFKDGAIRLWTDQLPLPTKTSDLTNDSGFITGMTILSYGHSTWNDFIAAYNANKVVYCRASSGSNPANGSQTRLAFMAYVNNAETPTNVEFQYYRSVATHSDSQQGDQVYVYKLDKTAGWTVTVREAYTKIAVGTGLAKAYSNGVLTISLA